MHKIIYLRQEEVLSTTINVSHPIKCFGNAEITQIFRGYNRDMKM